MIRRPKQKLYQNKRQKQELRGFDQATGKANQQGRGSK